ncbi:MAG: hypothetical protein JWM68_463 [Verrucomicrobiales bacterium]|nr:hypothetical protein [Verrucomicrobiales bacterium]
MDGVVDWVISSNDSDFWSPIPAGNCLLPSSGTQNDPTIEPYLPAPVVSLIPPVILAGKFGPFSVCPSRALPEIGLRKNSAHFASPEKFYKYLEVLPSSGKVSTEIWVRPDARKNFLQIFQRIFVPRKTFFAKIIFPRPGKLFHTYFSEFWFWEKSPTYISRSFGSGKRSPHV